MKKILQFKPKMFLQRDVFAALAWAGRLVIMEGWDEDEAILMATNYYGIENKNTMLDYLNRFIDEEAYTIVKVPNRLKGSEISEYLKGKG